MNEEPLSERETLLRLDGVTLGYPGVIAVRDVSFQVGKGEFIGIFGPNGSGKSTLLKGILGLLPVASGRITFFDKDSGGRSRFSRRIGYVPQKRGDDNKFPATAMEVVLMGLYAEIGWIRRPSPSHRQKAYACLKTMGMEGFAGRPIGSLSGGQQQRVMIARALAADPEMLILDEPTAFVDLAAQESILGILEELNKRKGMTIMMVSHDPNEIVHWCDRALLLYDGGSKFGTPVKVLTLDNLRAIYGDRVFVYDHHGHPHVLVGDFDV